MLEVPPLRSLERNPKLLLASVYEREITSSIEGVWENVFDWEHLPWLHSQAFDSIDLREAGEWGWHADIGFAGGNTSEIELVVDRPASCYVARTRSGSGEAGEIWTSLDPVDKDKTAIRVEFWVPPLPEEQLEQIGNALRAVYTGLWDQDEEMMVVRERARTRRSVEAPKEGGSTDLGLWSALRPELPQIVDFEGHRFRIIEVDGQALAHAAECPHWLGPLDACPVEAGVITCPWHGYRFDVASGRSADDRGMRLRPAPRVEIDPESDRVRLVSG